MQVARPATVTEEPLYANNTGESGVAGAGGWRGVGSGGSGAWRGEADTEQDKEFARVLEASLAEGRGSPSPSSSLVSTATSDALGACGGARSLSPDPASTVLGLGAAGLSQAELKAAEAAERQLEQERRDEELARQLQV